MEYLVNLKPKFDQIILRFRNRERLKLKFIQLFQFLKINHLSSKGILVLLVSEVLFKSFYRLIKLFKKKENRRLFNDRLSNQLKIKIFSILNRFQNQTSQGTL